MWGMKTPPQDSQTDLGFYAAEVDLFTSQETAQCPLYFSLSHPALLGLDATVHMWPGLRHSDHSASGSPGQGLSSRVLPLIDSALLADQSLVLVDNIPPQ